MRRPPPHPAGWLWVLGAATLVTAARWREIELHGGEIAFLDQWLVEARQILLPWLQGKLSLADFFLPHHEHVPAWQRLAVWLEAVVFGQWDARLQATINAILMGAYVGTLAGWLRRSLPTAPALALTGLAVILASLPHSWENIIWGFQSQVPLALFLVFVSVQGSFAHAPGTTRWWLAQAAGVGALFTFGSMWTAPLAVGLVLAWTARVEPRRMAAAAVITLAGLGLFLCARSVQPHTGAFALGAASLPQFLTALLTQLGWPSAWPGVALLLNLPAGLLALRLRRSAAASVDQTVLALAAWAAAQAAAFAYARGSYAGFVSRYGDLLAVGVLANGIALWRLGRGARDWGRCRAIVLGAAWSLTVAGGLWHINIQGHTLYFHQHSAPWAQQRREAVRSYLATRDPAVLGTPEVRAILFPDPAVVAEVLDQPRLVALLPASVQPAGAPTHGTFAGTAAGNLREFWAEFAGCGGLLLFAGAFLTRRGEPGRWPGPPGAAEGAIAIALGSLALGSTLCLFLWSQPFEFRTARRWEHFLTPPGTVGGLTFQILPPTNYPSDRLTGAAALWPEDFRNTFFGTHVDGPAFTGIARSSPFRLASPWYVVPFAGYPGSPGNAVRLQIEDDAGNMLQELQCPGPNPGPGPADIGFWAIDVRAYRGRNGRLVLSDGRTDGEGWVAVAPPQPAVDGAATAATDRRAWAAEGTLAGLWSLQVVAASSLILAASALVRAWLQRRRHPG